MAKFTDLANALEEMDTLPESALADLRAAYDADTVAAASAAEAARIDADANSAAAIAERDATIASLRSKNCDLMRGVPANPNAGGGTGDDETVEGDDGSDGDAIETPEQTTI